MINNSNAIELATRFREVYLNGKWIAQTNFKERLEHIHLAKAQAKIGNHNSIAMLTFHVHYYVHGVLQVLKGGELNIRDKYSFNAPTLHTEEDWQALKARFFEDAETFAQQVESMSDAQLKAPFVKAEYGSYQRNIEAMIEHAYYHLGQVTLLGKLLE